MPQHTKPQSFAAWMQTIRPANVLTSVADGLAGWAAWRTYAPSQDLVNLNHLGPLLVAHALLYAGGIMQNDVYDADLDRRQRPERPIPSGALRLSQVNAVSIGFQILAVGICLLVSLNTALWAALIVAATYWYNASAKQSSLFGPVAMGMCRSLNFLLPVSQDWVALEQVMPISLLPLVYIGGITLSSRYEVDGGGNRPQLAALVLYLAVMISLADLLTGTHMQPMSLAFVAGFAWWLLPAAFKAWQTPKPETIRAAVRAGVLGLLWYDAALVSIFWQWYVALIVIGLLPLCIWLGKKYSVT